ncbi:TetR/AcrR family transcriptional regulator [Nocardia cyriacigeorgica]|uniref:Potential acrAB operon repressor n=1 Tax=Nocardia cyriacigeorgica TaxID=135487 RepID=A0A4U8W2V4_9NOCA|nr:TetR/AcrR family transcriptional regulator [Nocardia cyriacigeorgica]MBF6161436.1 TetR/AcrR family transcriptional regulator [Nocardia cyriacigeorgica]MBF6200139.1 TetR/AcrR family transcriptional regulator [Nocardia cyriacigeorgica]MBF6318571.1 TetR/AcrR family transcriptional regulator [Nocardia cyriacigeorgica]MBF6346625.1 TetR/AcrR family transcriptional regulator [Nocardia cyriacigeorgica]MBF6531918.1 TetR/AcrR family transcriptional regulator [Nocardia cyriacigeorgica]
MPRASREQAESHRRQVLDAAAAQVRERGAGAMTVPELMAAAGLTHGGFYRHFRSKEDLVTQACTAAYTEKIEEMDRIRAASPDGATARRTFIERYLSTVHRDAPANGCGIAATAADVARTPDESPLRQAYLDGIHNMIGKLAEFEGRPGTDPEVLVELSVMAGALMLSRATGDDQLSGQILDAAREFLLADRE